jgi:hypothetical protein
LIDPSVSDFAETDYFNDPKSPQFDLWKTLTTAAAVANAPFLIFMAAVSSPPRLAPTTTVPGGRIS